MEPASDLRIRRARATDAGPLAPLMEDFNVSEGIVWRPAPMAAAFARLCDDPSLGFALVAEEAAQPVAYVVVTYNFDLEHEGRDAFVTELYVSPPARRRGLAASLLAAAEDEGRANDCHALHLLVSPENGAARALYERAGFAASPRLVMTKLTPPRPAR